MEKVGANLDIESEVAGALIGAGLVEPTPLPEDEWSEAQKQAAAEVNGYIPAAGTLVSYEHIFTVVIPEDWWNDNEDMQQTVWDWLNKNLSKLLESGAYVIVIRD